MPSNIKKAPVTEKVEVPVEAPKEEVEPKVEPKEELKEAPVKPEELEQVQEAPEAKLIGGKEIASFSEVDGIVNIVDVEGSGYKISVSEYEKL